MTGAHGFAALTTALVTGVLAAAASALAVVDSSHPIVGSWFVLDAAGGEPALHGSVSRWLAWSGTFDGEPATLVFTAPEDCGDPWFVRVAGYPGVGQSLAWDEPVVLHAGESVHRSITVLVSDARLGTADIDSLIAALERRS